jgi:hypothetical protein
MRKSSFKYGLFAVLSVAAAWLSPVQPADAELITQDFAGLVRFAEPGNPFGVDVNSPINISITFDNALLTGVGEEFIEIDSNPAFDLSISLGVLTFVASDDGLFGSGFPKLGFLDGELATIDFTVDFSFGSFSNLTLLVFDSLEIIDNANLDRVLVAGQLIPEPSSLVLLAGALVALGAARRRQA